MRRILLMAAFGAAAMTLAAPASACRINRTLDPSHVRSADVVLVGRIVGYRVVPRRPGRGDYARFRIEVDRVLTGRFPAGARVTWTNSTFAIPTTKAPGPYLIALRGPGARIGSPEPASYDVLQTPCSPPFMLEVGSAEAAAVRRALQRP